MNVTLEQPGYYQKANDADLSHLARPEGSRFKVTYFQFNVTFPPAMTEIPSVEFSDSELLMIAEKAGTFDFLNSPEEDIYNDVLKKSE
jgi:hypothetical protein